MFLEQQISILDHVALKTGVTGVENIQICHHINKLHFEIYY